MSVVIQTIIVPESASQCSEWMAYFNKLKEHFGEGNARIIWLKTWQVNGSTSCTSKGDFNTFLKKHQIDVSNAATAAIAGISDLGGDLLGLGKNVSKIIAYGAPILLVAVLATVLYSITRISKNSSVSDLALLTPEGQVVNLLKK